MYSENLARTFGFLHLKFFFLFLNLCSIKFVLIKESLIFKRHAIETLSIYSISKNLSFMRCPIILDGS